eukprot:6170024-Pleurochrysis_carterae.AAC.1
MGACCHPAYVCTIRMLFGIVASDLPLACHLGGASLFHRGWYAATVKVVLLLLVITTNVPTQNEFGDIAGGGRRSLYLAQGTIA